MDLSDDNYPTRVSGSPHGRLPSGKKEVSTNLLIFHSISSGHFAWQRGKQKGNGLFLAGMLDSIETFLYLLRMWFLGFAESQMAGFQALRLGKWMTRLSNAS